MTASGPGSAAATVAQVGGSSASNVHSAELAANAATNANTVSTIVKRDSSGNFSAGTITATLSGNSTNVTGVVAAANGGTGQTSILAAFQSFYESVATTLGDLIYGGASGAPTRLAGDTSNTKKFLTATASSGVAQAPGWNTIVAGDLPTITLTNDVTGSASGGSIATTIASSAVTNAKMANMAAHTVKANSTGSSAAPSDVSLVSAATASTVPIRDSNANVQANNFIDNLATTATAGSTTTLSVASAYFQQFTGSSNQEVDLPDTSTLVVGQAFQIGNRSTGTVTVKTTGGTNLVQTMASGSQLVVSVVSTASNAAASWDAAYSIGSSSLTNPMTTLGDGIVGGSGGSAQRLAVGSNGQYWGADTTATNGVSYQEPFNDYNFLVNSGFDYWQVGTSATVTATGAGTPANTYLYQADQWYVNNILGGGTIEGVITYSQQTASLDGSGFAAKVQITTAPTGTGIQNGCELYQVLSNAASKRLYNKTASSSIQVKAFGNVNQIGIQFYYATSEAKLATAIGSETLVSVNTGGYTLCKINGQALGTSQTTAGVVGVRIRPTAVSSGNLYDLNNGFQVEQGMLNLGPVAHTWHRQYEGPVQELGACQYFLEKSNDLTVKPGTASSTPEGMAFAPLGAGSTDFGATIPFQATKRTAPTMSFWDFAGTASKNSYYNGSFARTDGDTDIIANWASPRNWVVEYSRSASTGSIAFHWMADARI